MIIKPKGTVDIYGNESILFDYVENILQSLATFYNYKKIRTPMFENEELFKRVTGEETEVVKKQMYQFKDKGDRSVVLRPEGTASFIRAFIENKLFLQKTNNKFYYLGSMFRYERPQKGRQREFNQFGIEYICEQSALNDTEVVLLAYSILDSLKINDFKLEINSLGNKETRKKYISELKKFFEKNRSNLGEDALRRLDRSPLRILDDKEEMKKPYFKLVPSIYQFYSKSEKQYIADIKAILDNLNIPCVINHKLVRGLDYYSNLVFEFISTSEHSGAQDTIIGGGRYSDIIHELGGPNIGGIGFAIGIERLIDAIGSKLKSEIMEANKKIDVYIANVTQNVNLASLALAFMLRKAGYTVEANYQEQKMHKIFKLTDSYNPTFIIFAGEKEMNSGMIVVKNQNTKKQVTIEIEKLIDFLDKEAKNEKNK